ncbi:hypothetical protein CU098_002012, partial [Rhizopus stolonifer]
APITLADSHSYYSIDVKIGTPPQIIPVLLDTGSADLWVNGKDCPSKVCKSKKFNEKKSTSFKKTKRPFEIQYAIGHADGYLAQDKISINQATTRLQEFGYVTNVYDIEGTIGTLGLGFPSLAKAYKGYSPFLISLYDQGIIQRRMFSIYLNNKNTLSGEIIFGGVDNRMHKGDLHYMSITKSGTHQDKGYEFWQVQGLGIGIQKRFKSKNLFSIDLLEKLRLQRGYIQKPVFDYKFKKNEKSDFILDTGTTYTYLPQSLTEQIVETAFRASDVSYNQDSKQYKVSCRRRYYFDTIIQFKMSPGSVRDSQHIVLNLPLSDLIRPKDGNSTTSATYCVFGIAPIINSEKPSVILGLSTLKNTYAVFDMDNARVGIASTRESRAFVSRERAQQTLFNVLK